MTTSNQLAELSKAATRIVYFAEFAFASGTQRMSTFNQTITWGGYDWLGVGTLASISQAEESDSLESRSLTFTLNAAQPSWLALAVGAVEEYRARTAKLYMCPMNEQYQLVDTPELCWSGYMDMMSVGLEGENGQISLKCETAAYGLKRRPALRLNAAQQKKRVPSETGFDYLNDMIANPQLWLSRRFQQQ